MYSEVFLLLPVGVICSFSSLSISCLFQAGVYLTFDTLYETQQHYFQHIRIRSGPWSTNLSDLEFFLCRFLVPLKNAMTLTDLNGKNRIAPYEIDVWPGAIL